MSPSANGDPLLVCGTVALDTIVTSRGTREGILGGSGSHAALAAALHAPVRLLSAVGYDFPAEASARLTRAGIDMAGVVRRAGKRSMRWTGRYSDDLTRRETLSVELEVLDGLELAVPEAWRDTPRVFLANGDPRLQLDVLSKLRRPAWSVADTMNHWLRTAREPLEALARRVTGLIVNDEEAQEWTGAPSVPAAAQDLLRRGPAFVIVKRGEHGSLLATREGIAPVPAYPVGEVVDPTGAGDTFAGALLARLGISSVPDLAALRAPALAGTIAASFCVEAFGTERVERITREECDRRRDDLVRMAGLDRGAWTAR